MNIFTKSANSFTYKLIFIMLVLVITVISIITYNFNTGYTMTSKYTPLIYATMEIKLETTAAHLWFEEIISGDGNIVDSELERTKRYEKLRKFIESHNIKVDSYTKCTMLGHQTCSLVFLNIVQKMNM